MSSPTLCQDATQFNSISCHQASQGSSRLMSQEGEAERFNGLGRLVQSVGLGLPYLPHLSAPPQAQVGQPRTQATKAVSAYCPTYPTYF